MIKGGEEGYFFVLSMKVIKHIMKIKDGMVPLHDISTSGIRLNLSLEQPKWDFPPLNWATLIGKRQHL